MKFSCTHMPACLVLPPPGSFSRSSGPGAFLNVRADEESGNKERTRSSRIPVSCSPFVLP